MKNTIIALSALLMICCNQTPKDSGIPAATVDKTVAMLAEKDPDNRSAIEKGVRQAAKLWQQADGTPEEFTVFCQENYLVGAEAKKEAFGKISQYMESVDGLYLEMALRLQENLHEATGPLAPIDEAFAAYNPATHLSDDLYANKIAFIIALNFPELTLEEKQQLGNDRLAWAYARLGDMFTSRVPAAVQQAASQASSDADVYIAGYNIYAGSLLDDQNRRLFPEDMILLSHWNIRDEIKANYANGETGLEKQRILYNAMERIISQQIPIEAINSGDYLWNPRTNVLSKEGKEVKGTPENDVRYQKFLNNFHALKAYDAYTGDTYIDRAFSQGMEISVEDAQALFRGFLSAPVLKEVGAVIAKRLGRGLEPFDIWYDGFKPRSNINEDELSARTRVLYPNAEALENMLPSILVKMGFSPGRALEICSKIEVDAARGSGHAWGAGMKGTKSHLRTRLPENGTDYKGYNIAMHEFGHCVEQTISIYNVDYYMLHGVPNTAFTEALAFVFQKRDLELLGINDTDPAQEKMDVLDKTWQLAEIAGVSMLDIAVWKWMYDHPKASAVELRDAVEKLAKEVWNEFFAPVYGIKDQTILAVYSHMVSYPLYLSNYAYGQVIEFQLERYFKGRNLAAEIDRIYRLGCLTPDAWIRAATGQPLSVQPLLDAAAEAVK